ncbi:hypothetical protein RNN88_21920, partial [Escherichia coli]|nr:hypothetical protein [Escherichia coli]MDT1232948.1 hypothetical protein [Escherichia coli]MDT1456142.1 hypothetical protein [Escherichia coli]
MNKKLMYIFAIFIVAAITCISQPKKTTLRDKAMVNYAFDYLSSPGSLPFTTAATELSAIHGHSTGNDSNLLIVFYVQIMPDDFVMQLHR